MTKISRAARPIIIRLYDEYIRLLVKQTTDCCTL